MPKAQAIPGLAAGMRTLHAPAAFFPMVAQCNIPYKLAIGCCDAAARKFRQGLLAVSWGLPRNQGPSWILRLLDVKPPCLT